MCGKFTRMAGWGGVTDYAGLSDAPPAGPVGDALETFTPMRWSPVVHLDESGGRIATSMIWGFTDRAPGGKRVIRHMHARGETVDRLPTWSDAFRYRRGVTWVHTFNEGEEVSVRDARGVSAARTRTQQWSFRRRDGRPIILGVIFDVFDAGRGEEYEFAQVTTAANAMVGRITDRMPLVLDAADLPLWLGERRAPLDDVKTLLRSPEFSEAEWEMFPDAPSRGSTGRRLPDDSQPDLFG